MLNERERIVSEKRKLLQELPDIGEIIRGSMMKYYLTCGTKSCRCHKKGGKKHGPYWYIAVSYGGKKKQKLYKLRNAAVKEIKTRIENYRKLWTGLCAISEKNIRLYRGL